MTRIPYVRREELGPEGQRLWDAIVDGQGDLVLTADGGLAGPFNALVTAPDAGRRMSSLGATLRFGTSIERRLSEIAIITTGARWAWEVAYATVWLLCGESSYVNAHPLVLDGGATSFG